MNILIFAIILLVLVLVHEFGHFFAAKIFGVRVDEFGFGFPPKIFGRKFGETTYSFNLLPIGGFVKIYGETPDAENTLGADSGRSLVNKPKWQQAIVLVAGVFMNFLLAWVLFSLGFMSGLPTAVGSEPSGAVLEDVNLVVISVEPQSPAETAGLRSGDKILGGFNPSTLKDFIIAHPKGFTLDYVRGTEVNSVEIIPITTLGIPKIGIAMDEIGIARLPLWEALKEGTKLTFYTTKETTLGIYTLIKEGIMGRGSLDQVAGPVGMVSIAGAAYQFGFSYLLSFVALISINLALINLFPFPALDGGRLFFLLIEKIKGSSISPNIQNAVNTVGFGVLILLMILITYHDVVKLL